jgi:hypothetical protein
MTDTKTFTAKLAHNAEVLFKSGSSWVVIIGAAAIGYFQNLSADDRKALEAAFPVLQGWMPLLALAATFIGAKLKPSNAISSQTKALLEELIRLRMDAEIARRGVQAPTVTPLAERRITPRAVPDPVIEAIRAVAPSATPATLQAALRMLRSGRADFDPITYPQEGS